MSKLLEKIVEEQLVRFLNKKNTLSEYQFGFRSGRSTEDLLAKAVSDWSSNTDNGLSTVVVFMDLSKAFDKVLHQAILFTERSFSPLTRRMNATHTCYTHTFYMQHEQIVNISSNRRMKLLMDWLSNSH